MTTTQNRYYSNLGFAAQLSNSGGINNTTTQIQVSSSQNWPTSFPFVVSIDPGLGNQEELVLVNSGSGTALSPYNVTRGFDGTTAQPHTVSAVVVPKICQLDLAQPQQHLNLTGSASGAHGLPASAWSGGNMQLVSKQVLATSQSQVNFTSTMFATIPSTCNNLVVYANCKSTYTSAATELIMMQLNGFSGANYGDSYIQGEGSTASGNVAQHGDAGQTQAACGLCYTSASGANIVARNVITFPSYNDAVWEKGCTFLGSCADGASAANCVSVSGAGACAQVTAAISSITLFPQWTGSGSQFVANSIFELYAF